MRRKLESFSTASYDKGRPKIVQALWFATLNLFFMKWWLPKSFRPMILRLFGAKVGKNVFIRHRVRILWPWKLEVGDNTWLGEDLWVLNLEQVNIGSDVALSQGVMLCTGSHDYLSESFAYRNAPISIGDGVWLAAYTLILPGVSIGEGATVLSRCRVSHSVAPQSIIKSAEY